MIDVLLVLFVATETDRSLTHTHTHSYTHKYTEKQTSNVCIAPIFVPFCDKYLILSFLVFLTFFYFTFSHTHYFVFNSCASF